MEREILRGELYYANFNPVVGSEQAGTRPALIIQNDLGNRHSMTTIVAVITSRADTKPKLPTHHFLKAEHGLAQDSLVMLEQIRTIDKRRLKDYIGTLPDKIMDEIDRALAVSVGIKHNESYRNPCGTDSMSTHPVSCHPVSQ